ncbi:hypothetical protein G7K_3458-t1 [Saitoella complicata NRRL Y-17804]|uniref:Uncharacterized protein n=1 Tax=Saitoella complicata (strain BCRC 22490 / CBS 7301 / JCM 7358 / NBRC 10748 / NRRL Y-17804) TaxID=698492 RepID=A0A0E9NHE9_SAICN|nr:hypothetical protein G7K_3458-t1 [Saitoella complicata NRRL Y-17804]
MFGRLVRIGIDAVLVSTALAGIKRTTGLTPRQDLDFLSPYPEASYLTKLLVTKYLETGEWFLDYASSHAASSGWFEDSKGKKGGGWL